MPRRRALGRDAAPREIGTMTGNSVTMPGMADEPRHASPIGAAGLAAMPRWARALSWLGAAWIVWELGYYEQYKLTGAEGSVQLFSILSAWVGTPGGEKP